MPTSRDIHDFLASLQPEELAQARDIINHMLMSPQSERIETRIPEEQDRRRTDRYHVRLKARCTKALRKESDSQESCTVRIVDISLHGCCIVSERLFHPAEILLLEFQSAPEAGHRVFVEVTRVHRLSESEAAFYEIGCRNLSEHHIARAQRLLAHQEKIRNRLLNHGSIRILQLSETTNCASLSRWLLDEEYDLEIVADPAIIADRLRDTRAHLLIAPAPSLIDAASGWVASLQAQFPRLAFVGLASSGEEFGALRAAGIDFCLFASQTPAQTRQILERAFQSLCVPENPDEIAIKPFKMIVAGIDPVDVNAISALLDQEGCAVTRCLELDRLRDLLEAEYFDAICLGACFAGISRATCISKIRAMAPGLVIIVRAEITEDRREAFCQGADLSLPFSPAPEQISQCLNEAFRTIYLRALES